MGDRATKKYEVNPGLKAILAEGKTSTFSLTNLFDSEDFKRDEEENDELEDGQNDGQQFEDAPRSRDEREMMDESRPDEEAPEDGALEEDRSNRQRQEDRNQFRSEPVREYFFFSKNDERFERLKFYDSSKIERHNQDWNRKKEQLVMALARRRKSMKKSQSTQAPNRSPFNKDKFNKGNFKKQQPKQPFKRKGDVKADVKRKA